MADAPVLDPKQYRTTFDTLLLQGVRAGQVPARMKRGREWFREKAKELTHVTGTRILREEDRKRFVDGYPELGKMYLYGYDAKTKDKLPYWDWFPVMIPIDIKPDGWLGINAHYLPLDLRAKFLDALYPKVAHPGTTPFDDRAFFAITYEMLKSNGKLRAYAPCIKRYLIKQVKTRIMTIYPVEYDIALFLPLADWRTATGHAASNEAVWADSRQKLNRR